MMLHSPVPRKRHRSRSRILSAVQKNGNRLFGVPLYGQQVLSAISLLLTLAAIVFNKTVVGRQKEERK